MINFVIYDVDYQKLNAMKAFLHTLFFIIILPTFLFAQDTFTELEVVQNDVNPELEDETIESEEESDPVLKEGEGEKEVIDFQIHFDWGDDMKTITQTLLTGETHRYTFHAYENQAIAIRVVSPLNKSLVMDLFDLETDELINDKADEINEWEGMLPTTGDYELLITPGGGNAMYHLDIKIVDVDLDFN